VRPFGRVIEQSITLEERMNSRTVSLLIYLVIGLMVSSGTQAASGQPNFTPALFGDGELWGTKGTTELPPPKNNTHSFDKLFVFINGAPGQLPVSEAAPGNPDYNGGRWFTHTVMWLETPAPKVLMSYQDVMHYEDMGYLAIAEGSPGGPPDFFQCPLLPVK
jgi:hypothetical protein